MSKSLPKQPSLEHLKNEAKALLRLAREGDPEATRRVPEPRLALAQLAVAREYGFASWAKLKRAVEDYPNKRDALFAGIRAGDRDRVSTILDDNRHLANAYNPQEFGARPIGAAANRNDRSMIDLLLAYGADIDGRSDWWAGSFGALDFADEETSRYLLQRGATLTPHAASRLGMAAELEAILRKRPEAARERGGDGQYPLHFAKTAEIVDLLVDAGADIDARDLDHEGTPAQTQVLNTEVLRRLVERGASTDIFIAIALGDRSLVEHALREDPAALTRRTDEPGNPMIPQAPGSHIYTYNLGFVRPIQAAIHLGQEEIYRVLFERSSVEMQFVSACAKGDRATVGQILEREPGIAARLAPNERVAICEAAKAGHVQTVRLMLESGFGVDTVDREQMSPAHWAGFLGDVELLQAVLPYGPNLELKNMYGGTVLATCMYGSVHSWRKGGHPSVVALLLESGAKMPPQPHGSPEVMAVVERYLN